MNYKRNFIKRERSNDKKIPSVKEPYQGMEWTNNKDKKALRKDEPFVLMFRDFIFFDVKSYECRYGDLYIRNIVDGIILKRYFRMNSNDQLTVFKNRSEFDEFIDKVKEEWLSGSVVTTMGTEEFDAYMNNVESSNVHNEHIKKTTDEASRQFILDSYMPVRDSVTGDIVAIRSLWDGESFTIDDDPSFFDKVATVFAEEIIVEVLE